MTIAHQAHYLTLQDTKYITQHCKDNIQQSEDNTQINTQKTKLSIQHSKDSNIQRSKDNI